MKHPQLGVALLHRIGVASGTLESWGSGGKENLCFVQRIWRRGAERKDLGCKDLNLL
jgi:hypothetical protein